MRVSMGTFVAIEATAPSDHASLAAVDAAFAAVDEIDRRLHPGRANGDLSRINNAALFKRMQVHPTTWELLRLAQRLHCVTEGLFDPCLPSKPGRLPDIEVSAGKAGPKHYVTCHAPVALDFGGFAKGYAVDRAIDELRVRGCIAGLVNAGGDLKRFGPQTGPVLLRHPNGRFTEIDLSDAALAVSDADSRQRPSEHRGYYIRGGRTERPGDPLIKRYAAVVAKQAVIADALVKCVMLCSKEIAARALREFGAASLFE
jgi:thiamine biosynthesis lipoprotein